MSREIRLYPEGDRWLTAAMVDEILSLSTGRKYALMKRPFDPFPKPFYIGKSVRWLESKVMAWKRQQEQASEKRAMSAIDCVPPEPKSPKLDARALEFKERYEAGASLDQLCRHYRIGKQTLSDQLRAANTRMRSVGRPPAALIRPSLMKSPNSP